MERRAIKSRAPGLALPKLTVEEVRVAVAAVMRAVRPRRFSCWGIAFAARSACGWSCMRRAQWQLHSSLFDDGAKEHE